MRLAIHFYLLIALLALVLARPEVGQAQQSPSAADQAKDLLSKGDLQGALAAWANAARAEPSNRQHLQQYSWLRQIIEMRSRLDSEQDSQRFEYYARAVLNYYVANGMHSQALELAQQAHTRLKTADSAVLLGEAALLANRPEAAVSALASLEASQQNTSTKALLGLALARQGKAAEAAKVAQGMQVGGEDSPTTYYLAARLQATVGNHPAAINALRSSFEAVPPSRLDNFKEHCKQLPEFAAIAATPQFVEALATKSKVAESQCSGGSGCANCPMRGKCAGSAGR